MAVPGSFRSRHVVQAHEAALLGHFPGKPLLPASVLLRHAQLALEGTGLRMRGIDRVKFLQPVVPGDTLDIEVTAAGNQGGTLMLSVDGRTVVSGTWHG